ncbi:hypothetical protein PCANC_21376 [Puccinia coronata f. sp. avenae]|uniref:Uncharacterized protein n=1 Tax=Puccinia coronata f. sp. avenae TaxID=200324 RepID=A0A2N5S9E9_9BASI|nr:hypothetical protein PCANC_21376 [Puccinia coronata f. sp. avenae]
MTCRPAGAPVTPFNVTLLDDAVRATTGDDVWRRTDHTTHTSATAEVRMAAGKTTGHPQSQETLAEPISSVQTSPPKKNPASSSRQKKSQPAKPLLRVSPAQHECPPLPFDNAPGGTQESYLAPSQLYPNNQSCKLFFEESVNHRGNGTGQSHPMQMAPPNSQMIGMDPRQFQLFCDNSGNAAHNFQMATQAQLNQWVARCGTPRREATLSKGEAYVLSRTYGLRV